MLSRRLLFRPGLILLVLTASPGLAVGQETREAQLHDFLESYYQAFSDRDWDRFAAHFWPGATLTTVWAPDPEAGERVVVTSVPDFVAQAPLGPGSRAIFEERMTSAEFQVSGDLAQAWVHYDARFGDPGEIMTWTGIDAFTLIRHGGEWRIVGLAYASDGG